MKDKKTKILTMHNAYGEPKDKFGKHLCCSKCGFCLTCKDCICNKKGILSESKRETPVILYPEDKNRLCILIK